MSVSGALDLAISLSFVYLLISLLCTATCELIASLLALRQKTLADAIGTLLADKDLKAALYGHPLIKGISHRRRQGPSYIPTELFAAAALDVLSKGDTSSTAKLKEGLLALVRGTGAEAPLKAGFDQLGTEAAAVKTALGKWFDDSMARASGAYKRRSQLIVLAVAAVLVGALNADTVSISRALWTRPELRTAIAESASRYVAQGMPEPTASTADFQTALTATNQRLIDTTDRLYGMGLPFGWTAMPTEVEAWVSKLIGLLLTVLACSLGAPFWFDLLGKLVNIRGSGTKPLPEPEPH
jgi:hypothetical protein